MSELASKLLNVAEKITGKKIDANLATGGLSQLIAKKAIGNRIDINSPNLEATILCPEERERVHPAVHFERHLQRVTGCDPQVTVQGELEAFLREEQTHAPTVLYQLNDVKLTKGGFWSNKDYVNIRVHQDSVLPPVELDAATYVDNDNAGKYFAHWYIDFAPASLTATPERPALSCFVHSHEQIKTHGHSHAKDYENLFDLDITYGNNGFVKELHLLQDYSQNSYKVSRYLELRNRLEKNLQPTDCTHKGVYIARGNTGGKRALENEAEIIAHLEKKGFDIILPQKVSAGDIVKRIWNAPFVIGVDGGAVTHALFTAKRNAPFLILMPPQRFAYHYKGFCDALSFPYGTYVCEQSATESTSFSVDSLDDFDRLFDQLQEAAAKRA